MRLLKKVLILSLTAASFFQKSYAVDILTSPSSCFEDDEQYVKANCFSLMKETFGNREYWMLILFPVFILSENTPSSINTAQLSEMGYTANEIADFANDINTLQSAMIQRNLKFTSASEAKAWMQTFPLAPITRELMRIQK